MADEKPAHTLYASATTRALYGAMLDRFPAMAGVGEEVTSFVVLTPEDLRQQAGALPTTREIEKLGHNGAELLAQKFAPQTQQILGALGVPEALVTPAMAKEVTTAMAGQWYSSTSSESGNVCVVVVPEKAYSFMDSYAGYKGWLSDVKVPALKDLLRAPIEELVITHEFRHCKHPQSTYTNHGHSPTKAFNELDADRTAGKQFPAAGALNERMRMIGNVLEGTFNFVDGAHETSYVGFSPDEHEAAGNSAQVHRRLGGLVAAEAGFRQNAQPEKLLKAVQAMQQRGPSVAEKMGLDFIQGTLQAGGTVRDVQDALDELPRNTAGSIREMYGLSIAKDVLKKEPVALAQAMHAARGRFMDSSDNESLNNGVHRLAGLYLGAVADLFPKVEALRMPAELTVQMSPLPSQEEVAKETQANAALRAKPGYNPAP